MPDVAVESISATYAPQEETINASSRKYMRKLDATIPKDLVVWLAKPIIHRPQMVPTIE